MKRLLLGAAAAGGLGAAAVEALYHRQPGNAVDFTDGEWSATRVSADHFHLNGMVTVHNPQPKREVMLYEITPRIVVLSDAGVDEITVHTQVLSHDKDNPQRPDGYWVCYVAKPAKYHVGHKFEVNVEIKGPAAALDAAYAAYADIRVDTYGFEGLRPRYHPVVLPLRYPDAGSEAGAREAAAWRDAGRSAVLPVRTHLLNPLDDPVAVIARYASPYARPGDIVTIGETPLAVMQGRMRDPRNAPPGWFASRFCQFMSGEGSLGTSGGMQALVDQIGVPRTFAALAGGSLAKVARQDGWFYRIGGPQSRLVDDVTGTLPPYDRLIVLGPRDADTVCRRVTEQTGLLAAVVDANNLGRVDLVGSSSGVDPSLVEDALHSNPAGNGAETTPIVLIRPH